MNLNVLQASKQTPSLKEVFPGSQDLYLHRRHHCKGEFKTKRQGLLSLECFTF